MIAQLFNCSIDNVSLHLKNIFNSEELNPNSVIEEFSVTASDGKNYKTKFYNLDAIIAVGYRVNSKEATQFRIWATQTLKDFIIKGFVLNDEMLKNGKPFGKDYFDELLERIREIRSSERRFYQKISETFYSEDIVKDILNGNYVELELDKTIEEKVDDLNSIASHLKGIYKDGYATYDYWLENVSLNHYGSKLVNLAKKYKICPSS